MRSRQQYMDGKCTHEEYYDQFVTDAVRQLVRDKFGVERIGASYDPHFKDIPLNQWDDLSGIIRIHCERSLKSAGDCVSLAGCVCIAKRAAAQIRLEYAKSQEAA